jgi:hypothetical protein
MPTISLEIHPAIGIARLGTSEEFHLGPQPDAPLPDGFRDSAKNLKRQAARFRIFKCTRDDSGKLLSARELETSDGVVEWRVQLVNRKAASPNFIGSGRRNKATGDDKTDADLIIDSGLQTIPGVGQPLKKLSGKFRGKAVRLGDIQTDGAGRLIVCGGFGTSDAVPPQPMTTRLKFADNEGWHDDTADGSIEATVTPPAGEPQPVKKAWIIVGPPDFAPEIENLITLYDVAFHVAIQGGRLRAPDPPSFVRDIQPILQRAVNYQWVTRAGQGHSGTRPGNFAQNFDVLADPAHPPVEAQTVLRRLRDSSQNPVPKPVEANPRKWMPRLHDENNDANVLPLTPTQHACLVDWSNGKFVNDLHSPPVQELLPDALDRISMQNCSGGAFFPGIECGRIMKLLSTWDLSLPYVPFRINTAIHPGQITGGNAIPWQADFLACAFDPQLFIGWWPAQRPDDVFPETDPGVVKMWDRGISGDLGSGGMVTNWHKLGIVRRRLDANGNERFIEVERILGEIT